MEAKIEGKELVIRIPLQTPTPSVSGKTLVVASSHGCKLTNTMYEGKALTIGVNAFIKK